MGDTKKYLKKILQGIAATTTLYLCTVVAVPMIYEPLTQEVKSKSHLQKMIESERKRLNINPDYKIQGSFTRGSSQAQKVGHNRYEIRLNAKRATYGKLKHEIYHIAEGHCEKSSSALEYFLWNEPQAAIYCVTGLRRTGIAITGLLALGATAAYLRLKRKNS